MMGLNLTSEICVTDMRASAVLLHVTAQGSILYMKGLLLCQRQGRQLRRYLSASSTCSHPQCFTTQYAELQRIRGHILMPSYYSHIQVYSVHRMCSAPGASQQC